MRPIQATKTKIPKAPKIIPNRAHLLFLILRTLARPKIKPLKHRAEPISTEIVPSPAIPSNTIVPIPTKLKMPEDFAILL